MSLISFSSHVHNFFLIVFIFFLFMHIIFFFLSLSCFSYSSSSHAINFLFYHFVLFSCTSFILLLMILIFVFFENLHFTLRLMVLISSFSSWSSCLNFLKILILFFVSWSSFSRSSHVPHSLLYGALLFILFSCSSLSTSSPSPSFLPFLMNIIYWSIMLRLMGSCSHGRPCYLHTPAPVLIAPCSSGWAAVLMGAPHYLLYSGGLAKY